MPTDVPQDNSQSPPPDSQAGQDNDSGSTPASQAGSADNDGQPGPVPYGRFKEVNQRARDLEQRLARIEEERKAAREKELAEQEKWRELAEQREQELKQERLARTRQQVAMQKGIPADLVDRLQGSSEEELAADADRLLQFIQPAQGPGVPPASRNPQPAEYDLDNMTPAQIRELREQAGQ